MADMNALSVSEITRDDIKSRIYTIRGVQVMLDRDIAFLYGVETRVLNQAVKRNAERFPSGYCFQLTDEEFEKWKSQIVMSNSDKMGLRRNPFAFTERGVAMLSTVLHSPAAIKMSMQIMDAFVSMRHYLADVGNSNALLLQHLERIDDKLLEHDEKINIVLNELDKYKEKNEVIFDSGSFYDAVSHLEDIIGSAEKEIILVDGYVDKKTLDMLSKKKSGAAAVIYTHHNRAALSQAEVEAFNKQFGNLSVNSISGVHDRFLILDRKVYYYLGTSANGSVGGRLTSMIKGADEGILSHLLRLLKVSVA